RPGVLGAPAQAGQLPFEPGKPPKAASESDQRAPVLEVEDFWPAVREEGVLHREAVVEVKNADVHGSAPVREVAKRRSIVPGRAWRTSGIPGKTAAGRDRLDSVRAGVLQACQPAYRRWLRRQGPLLGPTDGDPSCSSATARSCASGSFSRT